MSSEVPPAVPVATAPDPYGPAEVAKRLARLGISATPQSAAEIAVILRSAVQPEPYP